MRKIIMISLLVILEGFLSGCTVYSNGLTPDYRSTHDESMPYSGEYQSNNLDYGHPMNATSFNHNNAIGYGGVDVYSYQGV